MPAFSLLATPENLPVRLQSYKNAPLPPRKVFRRRGVPKFGNTFSLVTSSVVHLSASELLRFLSRMAASEPTS